MNVYTSPHAADRCMPISCSMQIALYIILQVGAHAIAITVTDGTDSDTQSTLSKNRMAAGYIMKNAYRRYCKLLESAS